MKRVFNYTCEIENITAKDYLLSKDYSKKCLSFLKLNNGLFINDNPAKMTERLHLNDQIEVVFDEHEDNEMVVDTDIPLDITYEDEDIIVVNKQAGLPVHPSFHNYTHNLANALSYYYHQKNETYVNRCITRLDGDTSGFVLLAKNLYSAAVLSKMMHEHQIYKTYTAIVDGNFENLSGEINKPIKRMNANTIERMVDEDEGQEAITRYQVIKQIPGKSLLEIQTITGRTHQIRVHMAYIGHPLVGDWLYNKASKDLPRQRLHVSSLKFVHPVTKEEMSFHSPLPSDITIAGL